MLTNKPLHSYLNIEDLNHTHSEFQHLKTLSQMQVRDSHEKYFVPAPQREEIKQAQAAMGKRGPR